MLHYLDPSVETVSVHHVPNRTNGDNMMLSKEPIDLSDARLSDLFLSSTLRPFNKPDFYAFTFSNGDFTLNPVYNFIAQMFDSAKAFHRNSINLAQHLYQKSDHHQIKPGDLFVVSFKNLVLFDEEVDAIGIFKSENRQSFLKLDAEKDRFHARYDDGINMSDLDKCCLIFNTDRDTGFRVLILDKLNKANEAQFWRDDFLGLTPRADNYHKTQQFMSLCKNYITEKLPEEFEVVKTDQIEMLNKSVAFFKSNEEFDYHDFTNQVISEPGIIKSFGRYKDEFEQKHAMAFDNDFEISPDAVKRQQRIFKSVLKLDKNFHVYIHGDTSLIERGFDEDKKMNYYKIYYREEK